MDKKLQKIINSNPGKRIVVEGFFSYYPLKAFIIRNDSALLFGRSNCLWAHLVGSAGADMEALIGAHHRETSYFHSVEAHFIPLLKKFGEIDWQLATRLFVREDTDMPAPPSNKVHPLDPNFADYIYRHSAYNEYTSADYIRDRLGRDVSAGIFRDNKLVAWALTHDDGSLGFMNVLKDFREKGYARDIAATMVRMKMEKNEPVFANIEADNSPAIKLAEQFGFKQAGSSSWVKMKW